MTNRLLPLVFVVLLLFVQSMAGLHRASTATPVSHDTHLHNRLFAALERVDQKAQRPVVSHAPVVPAALTATAVRSGDATVHTADPGPVPDAPASEVCDLLDHLLNTPVASTVPHPIAPTVAQPIAPVSGCPARLSRFQQLGPPARGPPAQLA